MKKRKTAILY